MTVIAKTPEGPYDEIPTLTDIKRRTQVVGVAFGVLLVFALLPIVAYPYL